MPKLTDELSGPLKMMQVCGGSGSSGDGYVVMVVMGCGDGGDGMW